jgi:hypothetical protein
MKTALLLRLAMGSRVIEVRVDAPPESAPALIDTRLRITALAAGGINDRRQLVFPYLRVTDWSDVAITQAAHRAGNTTDHLRGLAAALSEPPTSRIIARVFAAPCWPRSRTAAFSCVIRRHRRRHAKHRRTSLPSRRNRPPSPFASPRRWLSHPASSPKSPAFPIMAGFSASLADALVLATEPGESPAAAVISLQEFQNGSHDADLVQLTTAGRSERLLSAPTTATNFASPQQALSIRAFLLQNIRTIGFEIGSACQLSGICLVESSTTTKASALESDRASLLLRSHGRPSQVLSTAPFWTARRLVIAIAILGGLILLTLFWITQQRRQITRLERKIVAAGHGGGASAHRP